MGRERRWTCTEWRVPQQDSDRPAHVLAGPRGQAKQGARPPPRATAGLRNPVPCGALKRLQTASDGFRNDMGPRLRLELAVTLAKERGTEGGAAELRANAGRPHHDCFTRM